MTGCALERFSPAILDLGIPCFLSRCRTCPPSECWRRDQRTGAPSRHRAVPAQCRRLVQSHPQNQCRASRVVTHEIRPTPWGDRPAPRFCSTARRKTRTATLFPWTRCTRGVSISVLIVPTAVISLHDQGIGPKPSVPRVGRASYLASLCWWAVVPCAGQTQIADSEIRKSCSFVCVPVCGLHLHILFGGSL